MQIRDEESTRRVIVFDSECVAEMTNETPATHHQAARSLSAAAGMAGPAVRMMRGPAASVAAPNEERLAERTRIAQELHDTLLQGFFAVSMQLHAAVESLPTNCAERPRFGTVIQLVNRVLAEGRCAVEGLRSPNERSTSLGEAFARVPNDFGFPSTVGFRVVVHGGERELREGLRDEINRIVYEAIVNAYRHSEANDIETEIGYHSAELRIAVRDNGRGIDPQILRWGRDEHWGLQGMRERADRIGARLRVLSRRKLGTEVELLVPGQIAYSPMTKAAGVSDR
jgi:signal transduction histidine kinase